MKGGLVSKESTTLGDATVATTYELAGIRVLGELLDYIINQPTAGKVEVYLDVNNTLGRKIGVLEYEDNYGKVRDDELYGFIEREVVSVYSHGGYGREDYTVTIKRSHNEWKEDFIKDIGTDYTKTPEERRRLAAGDINYGLKPDLTLISSKTLLEELERRLKK